MTKVSIVTNASVKKEQGSFVFVWFIGMCVCLCLTSKRTSLQVGQGNAICVAPERACECEYECGTARGGE